MTKISLKKKIVLLFASSVFVADLAFCGSRKNSASVGSSGSQSCDENSDSDQGSPQKNQPNRRNRLDETVLKKNALSLGIIPQAPYFSIKIEDDGQPNPESRNEFEPPVPVNGAGILNDSIKVKIEDDGQPSPESRNEFEPPVPVNGAGILNDSIKVKIILSEEYLLNRFLSESSMTQQNYEHMVDVVGKYVVESNHYFRSKGEKIIAGIFSAVKGVAHTLKSLFKKDFRSVREDFLSVFSAFCKLKMQEPEKFEEIMGYFRNDFRKAIEKSMTKEGKKIVSPVNFDTNDEEFEKAVKLKKDQLRKILEVLSLGKTEASRTLEENKMLCLLHYYYQYYQGNNHRQGGLRAFISAYFPERKRDGSHFFDFLIKNIETKFDYIKKEVSEETFKIAKEATEEIGKKYRKKSIGQDDQGGPESSESGFAHEQAMENHQRGANLLEELEPSNAYMDEHQGNFVLTGALNIPFSMTGQVPLQENVEQTRTIALVKQEQNDTIALVKQEQNDTMASVKQEQNDTIASVKQEQN